MNSFSPVAIPINGKKRVILQEKLDNGQVVILDGATGTEVARLGGAMNSAAWCAVANKTHPDVVRDVHESYLRAGVDVITTNTFATCRHVLAGAGLADETLAINRRAVEIAKEAIDNVRPDRPIAVAGSMSTTFAWIAGTTVADPAFVPTADDECANFHEMAQVLADSGVDLIVLEMMGDVVHASRCLEAAMATGLPVWVGISCTLQNNGDLTGWDLLIEAPRNMDLSEAQGEPESLGVIIDALVNIGGDVFGIMHSTVEATDPGLDCLFARWQGPVMAYPETLIFDRKTHMATANVSPATFANRCKDWVDSGVQIIGGCCGTTIDHIHAMIPALPVRVGERPVQAKSGNGVLLPETDLPRR